MQDPFVPYLIRHCIAGILAGWMTVGLLLGLDVRGLGTLVAASDLWPVPLIMLAMFFAITFGSVAMAAAIMSIGREDAAPGSHPAVPRRPAPVRSGVDRHGSRSAFE